MISFILGFYSKLNALDSMIINKNVHLLLYFFWCFFVSFFVCVCMKFSKLSLVFWRFWVCSIRCCEITNCIRFAKIPSCKTQLESNNNQQRHEKSTRLYKNGEKCASISFMLAFLLSHNDGTNMNIEHGQTDLWDIRCIANSVHFSTENSASKIERDRRTSKKKTVRDGRKRIDRLWS